MKSFKRFEEWGTNLWDKYRTDLFFRTTCHIIVLQIILTAIVVIGLWFVMSYLAKDTSAALINAFSQILQGQNITTEVLSERLEAIQSERFWPVVAATTGLILFFGFIMVYVTLAPTRRSLERKKRFIGNIAHELRTPLAIMRTNTDVALLDKELPSKTRQVLERNITEFERAAEIINNLLSLSNFIREDRMKFERVDLGDVAHKAMNTLLESAKNKDITLILKSHTKRMVFGNATALEQVVFNLLKNAIEHTKKRGSITVTIEPAGDGKYVHLSVSDSGRGIARDHLFRIFEPFFRAEGVSSGGGRGLGLAIVNEIVQLHHGKIRVRSAEGRGTIVIVSIRQSEQQEINSTEQVDSDVMEEIVMDFSHRILE